MMARIDRIYLETMKETCKMRKPKEAPVFTWNVMIWDFNCDQLNTYDVVPVFEQDLKTCKKTARPKTKAELDMFLKNAAYYHFGSKCEWEMIVHSWPAQKNEVKIDVNQQLCVNWDAFVNAYWENYKSLIKKGTK